MAWKSRSPCRSASACLPASGHKKPPAKPPAACCTKPTPRCIRPRKAAATACCASPPTPSKERRHMTEAIILPPRQRAWRRFAGNRRGWWSLWIFLALFGLSLFAELLSNDKPIIAHYQGEYYFPLWQTYPETTFGG